MARSTSSNIPPVINLAVPSPLRRTFDYLPPKESNSGDWKTLQPGMRLRVPFGKREIIGVITGISDTSKLGRNKLRHAIAVLDQEPLFSPALMKSFDWAAGYYQHPPGEVYSTLLPAKLRQGARAEFATKYAWISRSKPLQEDRGNLDRAPRQKALLQFIVQHGQVSLEQYTEAGFTAATLRELVNKALVEKIEIPATNPGDDTNNRPVGKGNIIKPNPGQQVAIKSITASLDGFACHLLDGITGSGKTEVYLQVIKKVLDLGKQALILVPEIGLTPQTIRLFEERFACRVAALHSGMTSNERLESWLRAKNGLARIIIGTRSAVFTPLARPGIIIVDEEHDASFKQQDGFRYSARDLAIVRAREEKISIVLGSATPALETLYNATTHRYNHLILSQRAGEARKSPINLLDLQHANTTEGFSTPLIDLIRRHLDQQNQVLIFINRRGFAPALLCKACGFVFECRRCDSLLTVHKIPPTLHCHHCESRSAIPAACPNCNSSQLATRGMGTEKTEQFLQQQFADIPVIRIDRDSTRNRNNLDDLLNQVQTGQPCIMVGTQMLAKGHHFPRVTLVAVLDADTGLFSPDFRGQELMVQLLFQVAGRAGRADKPGQVVVQTRHATHTSLQALAENDYHQVAELLLRERKAAHMPPFSHLALIRAEAAELKLPLQLLQQIHQLCEKVQRELSLPGILLHHPLPSPMEKRAGRYRAQFLLQAKSRGALQALMALVCPQIETIKSARKARWSIDVDPLDLI